MQQPGGATTITPDIRLILLDCFETLVELDVRTYRPRRGMREFLEYFGRDRGLPLAVVSDAHAEQVSAALVQANLGGYLRAVYHAGNACEDLGGGRTRKRLDRAVEDFSVMPSQTVFIGDSPFDASAAAHYGVRFIRVPRSEDRSFSFAALITGPSQYQSHEFNLTFLDRYAKPAPPVPPGQDKP